MKTLAILLFTVFSLLSWKVNSQTTWTGAVDRDWHKACNWNTFAVPTCTDNVIIPSVTNKPIITRNACCQHITVQVLGDLEVQTIGHLQVGIPAITVDINTSPIPAPPVANTVPSITQTSFTANWTASTGATTYYLDVATDALFTSFVINYNNTNVGNVTTYGITGLTCGTTYYYRIRAYNFCGTSASSNIIVTTPPCPPMCYAVGGTGDDFAISVVQTSDGGFVTGGRTSSFGVSNTDFYIVKFDAIGTIQWTRTVGGPYQEYANFIIQTNDGGYAIMGHTNSYGMTTPNGSTYNIYVVKLNANGTVQWTKTVGEAAQSYSGYSIIQTTDNGYVVIGRTFSVDGVRCDGYFAKLDVNGVLQWTRVVGGSTNNDNVYSIVQNSDGSYVATGYTSSYGAGNTDIYIVKLNADGTLAWTRTVGGPNDDIPNYLIRTSDGGYAITGFTFSYGSGTPTYENVYIVKLNADGTVAWTRTVEGANVDFGRFIAQNSDGSYIVAGVTQSYGTGTPCAPPIYCGNFYVIKLDVNGALLWTKVIGGAGDEYAFSADQTNDGGYIISGYTTSLGIGLQDIYIVKLDAAGDACASCNWTTGGTIGSGGAGAAVTSNVNTTRGSVTSSNQGIIGIGGTRTNICP